VNSANAPITSSHASSGASCGQNVIARIWNLRVGRSNQIAWRPSPLQPRATEVHDQQWPARVQAQALEEALDLACVDAFALLVEVEFADLRRCEIGDRDPLAAHCDRLYT
jgi:hypothetical protein